MSDMHKPLNDFAATLARPDVRAAEFDVLYEQSMNPTAFVAADGTFMSVNAAFADMLGYSRLELIGQRTWQDVTHREDIETAEREAAVLLDGKRASYRIQKRYLHKDGRYVYCVVQVNRAPVTGEFVHFVKQAREIPIASRSLSMEKDANGNPVIVPMVHVSDFLKRNWKVVAGVLAPVVAWVGMTANNYYEVRAKSGLQEMQIKQQQDELNQLRQRLDKTSPK